LKVKQFLNEMINTVGKRVLTVLVVVSIPKDVKCDLINSLAASFCAGPVV